MKNIIYFLLLLLFFACKTIEKDETIVLGVTREQVVAIATKYGMQDSIAEGYVSPHFRPFPPEAYPALTIEFWEGYFSHWRNFSVNNNEYIQFRREMIEITSADDYYRLIEKYPTVYQSRVNAYGGIEAYNKRKNDKINSNLHIYLAKDGSIVFIPAEGDDGTYLGKRLDKN